MHFNKLSITFVYSIIKEQLKKKIMEAKKRKSFEHQVEMQKELQSKGYNIIHCNSCGCIHIHKTAKKKDICYDCGEEIYFNECADLFY